MSGHGKVSWRLRSRHGFPLRLLRVADSKSTNCSHSEALNVTNAANASTQPS